MSVTKTGKIVRLELWTAGSFANTVVHVACIDGKVRVAVEGPSFAGNLGDCVTLSPRVLDGALTEPIWSVVERWPRRTAWARVLDEEEGE